MVEPRIAAIQSKIADYDLSMKAVSQRAGLGDTFVRDMLKRGRSPSAGNLDSVERAVAELINEKTGVPPVSEVRPADISLPPRTSLVKDVPVMGTAAGAAIGKGAFTIFREPVDFVMRPPGLMDARGIYALFVENDSMSPRYEPGELIYVNEFRPVTPGDYVVIQEPATNGEDYNAFVKLLVRRTAEWIETRQLNPPREVKFKNSKGLRIHKVMTNADMFGV